MGCHPASPSAPSSARSAGRPVVCSSMPIRRARGETRDTAATRRGRGRGQIVPTREEGRRQALLIVHPGPQRRERDVAPTTPDEGKQGQQAALARHGEELHCAIGGRRGQVVAAGTTNRDARTRWGRPRGRPGPATPHATLRQRGWVPHAHVGSARVRGAVGSARAVSQLPTTHFPRPSRCRLPVATADPLVARAALVDTPQGDLLRVVVTQWTLSPRVLHTCSGEWGSSGDGYGHRTAGVNAERRHHARFRAQRRGAAVGLPSGRRGSLGISSAATNDSSSPSPCETACHARMPRTSRRAPSWHCSSTTGVHQGRSAAVVLADDRRRRKAWRLRARSAREIPNGIDDFRDGTPTDDVAGWDAKPISTTPWSPWGLRATNCCTVST